MHGTNIKTLEEMFLQASCRLWVGAL